MNQFKLWIHFSPVGFQGNQGLCVCLCHQPAPLDCPELFCSKPAQAEPDQAEGESSSAALTALVLQPFVQFSAGKSKTKEVSMTCCVCVWKSWAWAELGKWMWHLELLWLLSPLDLSEPNNFITRASHQSKSHSLHSVFTTWQIISS